MFQQFCFAVILLAFGHLANGQVMSPGVCPEIPFFDGFDASRYIGLWYQGAGYPFSKSNSGKCNSAQYTPINATTIRVKNGDVDKRTNQQYYVEGYGYVRGPGELAVSFAGLQESDIQTNYHVMATDYISFSAVYHCQQAGAYKAEFVWLLFRDRNYTPETYAKAIDALRARGISTKELEITDQSNCPAVSV